MKNLHLNEVPFSLNPLPPPSLGRPRPDYLGDVLRGEDVSTVVQRNLVGRYLPGRPFVLPVEDLVEPPVRPPRRRR